MPPLRLLRALLAALLALGVLLVPGIASAGPTITISPSTVPDGTVAVAYAVRFSGSGGSGPLTFSTANTVPAGLTLAADGLLSGTPTQGGAYPITVDATDASMTTGSVDVTITIAAPRLAVAPAELTRGTAGKAFSQQLSVSGGTAPYSFALTAGSLPAGLAIDAGGLITGTPSHAGGSTFTVTTTDGSNAMSAHGAPPAQGPFSATKTWTLVVDPGPLSRLELTRTSSELVQGVASTWHTEGFDATGDDLGDLSGSTTLSIAPDGTCSAITCTPRLGGAHTITATSGAVSTSRVESVTAVLPDLRAFSVSAGNGSATVSWDYVLPPAVSSLVTVSAHDQAGHVHRFFAPLPSGTTTLRGLTNGEAWTIVLALASEAGDSSREIGVVTPGGLPTLSLKAVRHGTKVALSGTVAIGGRPLEGRQVVLVKKVGSRTVRVGSVRTGSRGTWSKTISAAGRTSVTATTRAGTATIMVTRAA